MAKFSEINTSFAVYENGFDFYGIADITLPNVQQITEAMEGAGVSGKYDAIVVGHVEAMKMSLQFRNPTEDAFKLFTPETHILDLRGNVQERDTVNGVKKVPVKHVVQCEPINLDLGKLANYAKGDTKAEYTVSSITTYINGKEVLAVSPFDSIYRINGVDYLEEERKNLGKA